MTGASEHVDRRVRRIWAAVTVSFAIALFFVGGGVANLASTAGGSEETELPVAIEPAGELSTPPTTFRWTPGSEDALAQLLLHRVNYERFWESGPLRGLDELEIPLSVYDGVPAGETLFWRVRELRNAKPVGTSAYREFVFRVDSRGYGPGEAPVYYDVLD